MPVTLTIKQVAKCATLCSGPLFAGFAERRMFLVRPDPSLGRDLRDLDDLSPFKDFGVNKFTGFGDGGQIRQNRPPGTPGDSQGAQLLLFRHDFPETRDAAHSGLTPAARTASRHFTSSALMCKANSSGVLPTGDAP